MQYYNLRGARERDFDALNNDFGWGHLPCSFLNENTVFLLLMAMCKNFYTAILYEIGKVFSNIKPKHRLKKFIYRFISVPAKWVRTARTHVLRLSTRARGASNGIRTSAATRFSTHATRAYRDWETKP